LIDTLTGPRYLESEKDLFTCFVGVASLLSCVFGARKGEKWRSIHGSCGPMLSIMLSSSSEIG